MTDPMAVSMDTRQYPRIQLPFEVEVGHPSFGRVRCVARDISQNGMFIQMDAAGLRSGAKVKVTVLNAALVESSPTPTVDMEVVRVAADGIGLSFTNTASHHLWESVDRLRDELRIGQDYFQVFQAAAIVNQQGKLLVVQRHGKWLFPGDYLIVGAAWQESLAQFLADELGIDDLTFEDTLGVDSAPGMKAVENATFSVFHRFSSNTERVRLREGSRYRHAKWVSRTFSLEELTFPHPLFRRLAALALERAEAQRSLLKSAQPKLG
jgi:ADP-ribose pyrophosphatase YjhB (NUDIX family)